MQAQIRDMWITLRREGFRATFRKYGWRFVGLVFIYYLIRDTLLYIVLPYLAWSSFG